MTQGKIQDAFILPFEVMFIKQLKYIMKNILSLSRLRKLEPSRFARGFDRLIYH
jgi:hypothetical protein